MIDIMGNYTGYDDSLDTEEERKRKERLAAEKATPVKQTITTDPTTGAQNVKIEGSAYNLSSANPNTPTVSGPAVPSNAQYLAQNESGNNPQIGFHNPAVSSAYGTYGITAPQYQEIQKANPAFANRPITSLSPQEQTTALGTSNDVYAQQLRAKGIPEVTPGMVNAAHLTGAGGLHQFLTQGTVNPALAAQNGGEDAFRQNILNRLASQPSPASGAAPQPMPAAQPQPMAEQPQPVAPTPAASLGGQNFLQANQTAIAGGAQPGPGTPMSNNPFLALAGTAPAIPKENQMYADFLKNQDNLRGIDQVEATHAQQMPSWLKSVVNDQRYSLMNNEVQKYQAEKEVKALQEQGNTTALGRILAEKSRETGSWPKAILYGLIGATGPAQEELAKLGYGKRWQEVRLDDGRVVAGEFRRDGIPLQGYDVATGKKLTSDELGGLIGQGSGVSKLKPEVSMQDVERNGKAGRVVTTYDAQNRPITRVESGGKFYEYDSGWKPRAISTSAAKADIGLITDLKKKHGNNVLDAEKDFVALNGPFKSSEERAQFRSAYGFDLAQPSGAPATAGGAVAPTPLPTAASANVNVPLAQQKVNKEVDEAGRKEIVKKAGDVVAGADKIVTTLVNVERAATDALTKKNNFGTIIHNIIPGEQTIGRVLKTQDHINTQNVLEQVNKQAAVNAKMLGTNPTDRDLQFVTSTKPDETWSAEAVADWLRKSADATRRTLDYARKQIETGGRYIPETPQEGGDLGTAANPIKLK